MVYRLNTSFTLNYYSLPNLSFKYTATHLGVFQFHSIIFSLKSGTRVCRFSDTQWKPGWIFSGSGLVWFQNYKNLSGLFCFWYSFSNQLNWNKTSILCSIHMSCYLRDTKLFDTSQCWIKVQYILEFNIIWWSFILKLYEY